MGLVGKGIIAIWQDLIPEAIQDYYEWHNREHMPERLSIPGFRRARRFVAVSGSPEFYTLYEAESHEDVGGKAYLERLNAPTEWTRRIMPAFRNMARSVCRVAYSAGAGEGGFMMTQRFSLHQEPRVSILAQLCEQILPPLTSLPGVAGVHFCLADESASTAGTFEKTLRTAEDLTPPYVLMVEGDSCRHVRAAADSISEALAPIPLDTAIYQFERGMASCRCCHHSPPVV
jgi:hypothetical protein